MANPRRTSYTLSQLPVSDPTPQFQSQGQQTAANVILNSVKVFLKKPHAFPCLLLVFLLLTWISLRFQRGSAPESLHQSSHGANGDHYRDIDTNMVKFSASSPLVAKDKRGWLVNPVSVALDFHIQGGAVSCLSIHAGEIRPGGMRGNHRHHTCNETFIIWGAKTMFRLENDAIKRGYSEMIIGADEVAVAASPRGLAHALVNEDSSRSAFFLGCQDSVLNYSDSSTDFKVWHDL